MAIAGSLALLLALALAAYNLVVGSIAQRQIFTRTRGRYAPQRLARTARLAGLWGFAAVSLAVVALLSAIFTNNFSLAYVARESNRALPAAYKLAALWSGQEGSLLLWAWILSGFSFLIRFRPKTDARLTELASTILAAVEVFFLLLLNFVALPFAGVVGPTPLDGSGMNPLLQNPEMIIHPPMLYLGYVGFSIPFAFVLAALILRAPADRWIAVTRRWSVVVWLFLTCGIILGMHWAYAVLGWGGYWGWDPVENASLMPWLTGTAFLHSIILQERRGILKKWNVWLIFSTFLLCIVGTTLTRSGVVSSVHAFGKSSLGSWFLGFLLFTLAVCAFAYLSRRAYLAPEHSTEGLLTRESSFLFLNVMLTAICLIVFAGTLLPVFSELFTGDKLTVGAPFYNQAVTPMALFLLLLITTGPLLAKRASTLKATLKPFLIPFLAGAIILIGLTVGGIHPWTNRASLYACLSLAIAATVITAIVSTLVRDLWSARESLGMSLPASARLLLRANARRYGAYTVHVGLAVMFIGFAGTAFNHTVEKGLNPGQQMSVGPYQLTLQSLHETTNSNFDAERALIQVSRPGHAPFQLAPEIRFYLASQSRDTTVADHSTPLWDLYLVYQGNDPQTNLAVIDAILNPLVVWVWIGAILMFMGSLLVILDFSLKLRNAAPATAAKAAAMASKGS